MNIHPIARLIRYCLGRNIACVKINSVKKQHRIDKLVIICYVLTIQMPFATVLALTELFADGLWTASKSFS